MTFGGKFAERKSTLKSVQEVRFRNRLRVGALRPSRLRTSTNDRIVYSLIAFGRT